MLDVALWVFYRFQAAGVQYVFGDDSRPQRVERAEKALVFDASRYHTGSVPSHGGWAPPASYHHRRGKR